MDAGNCYIHDIRSLSCHDSLGKYPSLIYRMKCGENCHKMNTSLCTGLVTDPMENFLFSPFISNGGDANIAAWSMLDGAYLFSYKLFTGEKKPSISKPFIELSSNLTQAYEWPHTRTERETQKPQIRKDSFGLWFKCNYDPPHFEPRLPGHRDAGGIHHISLPGKIDF